MPRARICSSYLRPPETDVPKKGDAGARYYGPGTYHENLDPKNGETIYLTPGAVVFGALNLWRVENVKVLGRGVIVYDGPQNPNTDEGWMHKPKTGAISRSWLRMNTSVRWEAQTEEQVSRTGITRELD